MVKYVPKKRQSVSGNTKTLRESGAASEDIALLGNLEVRKQVYAYLQDEVGKPASTRSEDLVPLMVEAIGEEPPSEFTDDLQDTYCWAVFRLISEGAFVPSKMAYNAWMQQSRPRLVKASMDQSKASAAFMARRGKVTPKVSSGGDDDE
jgi:hypothetical protein